MLSRIAVRLFVAGLLVGLIAFFMLAACYDALTQDDGDE